MSTLSWTFKALQDIPPEALHAIYKLRVDVFVVEQNCPYPEVDEQDLTAIHVQGHAPGGELAAYARILRPDDAGMPHLGRVVVHRSHRGHGRATELMQVVLEHLYRTTGSRRNAIAAQCHLQAFYEGLGYTCKGVAYVMDGIPHIDMEHP